LIPEITVNPIPVVGIIREVVLLPVGNVPFNELKPQFFVFFGEVRGCKLHGVLKIYQKWY
jgi:hypothetical protein